jgi:hypothetical protein
VTKWGQRGKYLIGGAFVLEEQPAGANSRRRPDTRDAFRRVARRFQPAESRRWQSVSPRFVMAPESEFVVEPRNKRWAMALAQEGGSSRKSQHDCNILRCTRAGTVIVL